MSYMKIYCPNGKKKDLFDHVLQFRKSSYLFQDLNLIADHLIVGIEERGLAEFGYAYEEYQNWKNDKGRISNPDEVLKRRSNKRWIK